MVNVVFITEVLIASVLIFFISGRLIGNDVNLSKRILSVVLGVFFTTFVFWYTYLSTNPIKANGGMDEVLNVATLLWFGSMLLISMLLYLLFELFDPIQLNENGDPVKGKENFFKRLWKYWRRQKRLRQVISIAMKNGITRTVKYVRHRETEHELAVALRMTLEQCGGIFIKFGQVLSTRSELLSPVFIEELEKLQQSVKPVPYEEIENVLKESLNSAVEDVFSYIEQEPLAAASIGQVHKAILKKTNEQVVVKVLRPDVKAIIREDLSILVEFSNWITSKSSWAESLGFKELAIGFANALHEETDFRIEARNVLQVQNTMSQKGLSVHVPKVYVEHSSEKVLVMDYIDGVSAAHAGEIIDALGLDRKLLARTLLHSFLKQALVSGIFHADPHPGNIYIDRKQGFMTMLDFGAVGRLAAPQQEGLKLFLLGLDHTDARLVYDGVTLLVENASEVDSSEVELAISQTLLKISYIEQIPTDELIYSVFSIVSDFGLRFYPSVSVALRAVVTVDGTLKVIDPSFDIFEEAKEYSSDHTKEAWKEPFKNPKATKERIEEELAVLLPTIRQVPRRIDQLFKKVESGKVILHHDIFSDKANASFVTQLFSQFVLLLVGITFGIISVALLAISQVMNSTYAIYLNSAAYIGLFLCAVLLVRLSILAIRNMKKY